MCSNGRMGEKEEIWSKPGQAPLCPLRISHSVIWDWTQRFQWAAGTNCPIYGMFQLSSNPTFWTLARYSLIMVTGFPLWAT
jgi:hypothetical protein